MRILSAPHPILFKSAKPVKKIDNKIKRLVKQMEQTLAAAKNPEGIGLAAPQVGHSLRIFIVKLEKNSPLRVFINPKIIKKSKKMSLADKTLEGCLSIPQIWGSVARHQWIKLRYQNLSGETREEKFSGLLATVIQHEMDHLEGKLFTSRALQQGQKLYRKETDKAGKPVFREVDLQ